MGSNDIGYKDLAPLDNITDKNTYIEALNWAIKNPRIKNIALTGPFGSGKSSIIQSYIKSQPNMKTVSVSLAAFQENKSDGKKVGLNDSDAIEEGILKQLFYTVSHRNIPQSRYRKLHRIGYPRTMIMFGASVIFIGFWISVFLPDRFDAFTSLIIQAGNRYGVSRWFTAIIAFTSFICLDFVVVKIYRSLMGKVKLKEIKIPATTTVSAEHEEESSVFNRNLDEIIYYFEEMQYDVVYFEDLDRLQNAEIFVKLRELNNLLNKNVAIKKPVKFVYAVQDDIFTETDRTKFFEFIIPIVPVMNSTNSSEMLTNLIENSAMSLNISSEYISDVAPLIFDMRLLQNAYNEFLIYKRTLQADQSLDLDDQVMLSLVIFKNLYPKEFADLQAENGVVKQAINDKAVIIDKKRQEIQGEIEKDTKLLKGYSEDTLKRRKELVGAFFCAVTDWKGYALTINVGGTTYQRDDFFAEDFKFSKIIQAFKNSSSINGIYYNYNGGGGYSYTVPNSDKLVFEYEKRFEHIELEDAQKADNLRKEIGSKQEKLYSIGGYSIKRLIDEFGVEILSDNVRANQTLVYLLRKGYIDERYADYMNYFKGTSITTADKNFLLSVRNHDAYPFNYELTKTAQIVLQLQVHEFEQKEILNFELLEYILRTEGCEEKRERFLKNLSDESAKSWEFFEEFAEKTEQIDRLIHEITKKWPRMWAFIYDNVVLTYEKKIHYLVLILTHADVKDIVNQDVEGKLTDCLLNDMSILQELVPVQAEKIISVIQGLDLRFTNVELVGVNEKVATYIVENAFYVISNLMLHNVTVFVKPELVDSLEIRNYSTLREMRCQPLLDNVHKNWDMYVEDIVLSSANTEEDVESIAAIIARSLSNIGLCINVIVHQNFVLDKLDKFMFEDQSKGKNIIRSIWNQILVEDKLYPCWHNVGIYWENFGITDILIQFIERNNKKLVKDNLEEIDEAFIREYITSTGDTDAYRTLISKLKLTEFNISVTNIPYERMEVLIDARYFTLDIDIYNQIRTTYPELLVVTLLNYQEECVELIDKLTVDREVLEQVINSDLASNTLKNTMLKSFGESYMSERLASLLCDHELAIDRNLFLSAWDYLEESKKKVLLYKYNSLLKADDFERCFGEITEFQGLRERVRHNVELAFNEENLQLAKRLEKVGYITSQRKENRERKIIRGKETHTEKYQVIVCVVKAVK